MRNTKHEGFARLISAVYGIRFLFVVIGLLYMVRLNVPIETHSSRFSKPTLVFNGAPQFVRLGKIAVPLRPTAN